MIIHQVSALPLGLTLELAPLLGAELVMPWALPIGLVLLGWLPLFFPRLGWPIGLSMWALGALALLFADFGAYGLGTAAALIAGLVHMAAGGMARRSRKAAKDRARMTEFI